MIFKEKIDRQLTDKKICKNLRKPLKDIKSLKTQSLERLFGNL